MSEASLGERVQEPSSPAGGGKVGNLFLVFHFSRAVKPKLCECGNRAWLARFPRGGGNGVKPVCGFARFPRTRHLHSSWLGRLLLSFLIGALKAKAVLWPVSMMCAWSVMRSISALQRRVLGMTLVHSEKGKLVVRMTVAFSARSAMTWKRNSAPTSAIGT